MPVGFGLNEIIWEAGWIWIIILVMGIAAIFDEIRYILSTVQVEKEEVVTKPKYEVLFRRRIE